MENTTSTNSMNHDLLPLVSVPATPETQSDDVKTQADASPRADLEPTTKSVPRKSDEPIERGNQQNPQTTNQDANKS